MVSLPLHAPHGSARRLDSSILIFSRIRYAASYMPRPINGGALTTSEGTQPLPLTDRRGGGGLSSYAERGKEDVSFIFRQFAHPRYQATPSASKSLSVSPTSRRTLPISATSTMTSKKRISVSF